MYKNYLLIGLSLIVSLLFSQCSLSYKAKTNPDVVVHGYVAPGFEDVKEEYIRNYTKRKENGSAVAVYYKGERLLTCGVDIAMPLLKQSGKKTQK